MRNKNILHELKLILVKLKSELLRCNVTEVKEKFANKKVINIEYEWFLFLSSLSNLLMIVSMSFNSDIYE